MSLIRPKQIGLNARGDLIIGSNNPNNNGEILPRGADNQALFSDGTSLNYEYVSDLYDNNGVLLLNGVTTPGSVNYLQLLNSPSSNPVILRTVGADTDINFVIDTQGSGRVIIDGNRMPSNAAPQYSILASNAGNGDFGAVTATDGSGDQVLVFNDVTDTIEWTSVTNIVEAFTRFVLTSDVGGVFNGTQPLLASTNTTVYFYAFDGITIAGNSTANRLQIGLGFNGLTLVTDPAVDVDRASDYLAFYDASENNHATLTFDQLAQVLPVRNRHDEAVAVGSPNESFVGFFAETPVNDQSITVFFNGIALRATGWTRAGNNLTLVDSVNGYSTQAGDIISARYVY